MDWDWDWSKATSGFAADAFCVHMPHHEHWQKIQDSIAQDAWAAGKAVGVARDADWPHSLAKFWNRNWTAAWLARRGRMGRAAAEAMINASPIHIRPRLTHNAGDPRRLLGVMALAGQVDVLMFDTLGNSPAGVVAIRDYVLKNFASQCVIYMAAPGSPPAGDYCLPDATCFDPLEDWIRRDWDETPATPSCDGT